MDAGEPRKAAKLFETSVEKADKLPQDERVKRRSAAYLALGRARQMAKEFDAALAKRRADDAVVACARLGRVVRGGAARDGGLGLAERGCAAAREPQRLGGVVQRLRPREVAGRLPVLLDAYARDDWVAADVLQNGMYQLTQLGMAAWKKVAGSVQPDVRVAYGGGVLEHNEVIRDGLERTMQASFGGQLLMLSLSSSAAAEAAARLAGGWHQGDEADTEWVERVSL